MHIKKNIPNFITCLNLLCGCLAIVSAFSGDLIWSAYLVSIAAVLDFFDGFAARILNVHSEIGKQLDSLADVVTFGVVPGVVMFQMIKESISLDNNINLVGSFIGTQETYSILPPYMCYIAFLITVFSAIRLAKFNIDTRQTESFIGLPTPANAILICSFPLIIDQLLPKEISISSFLSLANNFGSGELSPLLILRSPYFLIGLTILMSYLLVAELPLFALKFKNFTWTDNKIRYVFLIISLILLIQFYFIAIPFIIFLYIILSVINNIINRKISNP